MSKAYFCTACKKLFGHEDGCTCEGQGCIKEVKLGTPVNVVGTKLKGKVYRINDDKLQVVITSNKNRDIREYSLEEVRKIL